VWLDCGEEGSGLREMRPRELNIYLVNNGKQFVEEQMSHSNLESVRIK
jgi:hypothetical protein